MTSLTVTYVLWLCGGIFGLHHLYLNRPQHCFIWFVTWGGMLIGWLTEVTRLREYVEEANEGKEYRERMKVVRTHNPKPGFSIVVLGSQLMIGHQLGNLLISCIPEFYTIEAWYGPYLSHVLAATGAALGVHLASNIGCQEAPLFQPLLAAVATTPTAFFLYNRRNIYIMVCVIVASYVSSVYSRWVTKKKPSNLIGYLKSAACVALGISVYGALWTSNMYHNSKVHTLNGTRIHLRDAIYNFARTQPWEEAQEVMLDLIPCLKMYSMESCQHQILSALTEISDPQRDAWAFDVLGFDKYPTQKQVNSHCRKMSSKWHPDRFTRANETEKKSAEKKFIDIQKACLVMNKLKNRRERKNTYTSSDQSETVTTDTDDVYTQTDDRDTHEQVYDKSEATHKVYDENCVDSCHTNDEHGINDNSMDEADDV